MAVNMLIEAEEVEADARQARRRARARLKHYENLLDEYNGQLTLIEEA